MTGNVLGLLFGGVGIAAAAVAIETWTGRRFRWHPFAVVSTFVVAYVAFAVYVVMNMGP